MADIVTSIVAILKADAAVAAATGGRVFGTELPKKETPAMPRAAIVVQPSGGVSLTAGTFSNHDTQRLDLFYYGATPFEAAELRRLGGVALKAVRRRAIAGCLVHWVDPAGGFSTGRDRDADWPLAFQSHQVFFAELAQ